jgi:hypothetical protein
MLSERRGAARYPVDLTVRYRLPGGVRFVGPGRTINMSSNGLLFTGCDSMPDVGTRVEAAIDWPVRLNQACPLQLVVRGLVARRHLRDIGLVIVSYQFKTRSVKSQSELTRESIIPASARRLSAK